MRPTDSVEVNDDVDFADLSASALKSFRKAIEADPALDGAWKDALLACTQRGFPNAVPAPRHPKAGGPRASD